MNFTSIFDVKNVNLLCSCSRFVSFYRSYFCRYCFNLRCANCITHEVDCYYCPTCLENMASAEASARRDKCSNCFDCPSCGNMLSVRASVVHVPRPGEPNKPDLQKMYYMACSFCRWTTRDSGIADKTTSSNAWSQPESPHNIRIKDLINQFNEYAVKEKLEKEKTRYATRKNYFYLMESGSSGRRRYSVQNRLSSKRQSEIDKMPVKIQPQEAVDKVDDIDESIFEKKLVLEEVTNIQQRLRDPERQPQHVKDLYPISKQILVKRSMRCKKCDHNLCKPDIATTSIRFKINLSSLWHVPELRMRPLAESLKFNKSIRIVLTLTNPAHRITKVKVGPVTDFKDEVSTAKIDLPQGELQIGAKNEMLPIEELDTAPNEFPDDDPKIIADRKGNKIEFFAHLTPMKSKGSVLVLMTVWFEFRDATVHYGNSASSNTAGNAALGSGGDISWQSVIYKLDFGTISED